MAPAEAAPEAKAGHPPIRVSSSGSPSSTTTSGLGGAERLIVDVTFWWPSFDITFVECGPGFCNDPLLKLKVSPKIVLFLPFP
ncbi:unnamed protein product [Urochloa humidicola]